MTKQILSHYKQQARDLDKQDPIQEFARYFYYPRDRQGRAQIYLAGHSLGLQPVKAKDYVDDIMNTWAELGVQGHFKGSTWYDYPDRLRAPMASIVGAHEHEVVIMNSLSVNLHLLLQSFYRPTAGRYKILRLTPSFPSDRFVLSSHLQSRGIDPDSAIITVGSDSNQTLSKQQLVETLMCHGSEIALAVIEGVNYLTGECYPLRYITELCHSYGIYVGFDLAHAAGNVELKLHDWQVDFAAWCNYKYINAGPGAVAACFIHENHCHDTSLTRYLGWWGIDSDKRFNMQDDFPPTADARGWQLSTPPVMAIAPLKASLMLFQQTSMSLLASKARQLTDFFGYLLDKLFDNEIHVITPDCRGAQLSLTVHSHAERLWHELHKKGVVCDYRPPDVLRLAFAPLYTNFEQVLMTVEAMQSALQALDVD